MTSSPSSGPPEGRELDSEIAVKVFGRQHLTGADVPAFYAHRDEPVYRQEVWIAGKSEWWCRSCGSLPAFSTDIAAAFLVVEKMRELGFWFQLQVTRATIDAEFTKNNTDTTFDGAAYTIPLAICSAALAASVPTGEEPK